LTWLNETWLPVVGFPYYEVSNLGQVRSIDRTVLDKNSQFRKRTGKILAPVTSGSYYQVMLSDRKMHLVHAIVCTAFHGPKPFPDYEVSHIDGDSHHNNATNVLWESHLVNMRRKQAHKTQNQGETCNFVKLTEVQVIRIRELIADGFSDEDIAGWFNVTDRNIRHIKKRRTWKHL